jgi:hypothetical protein
MRSMGKRTEDEQREKPKIISDDRCAFAADKSIANMPIAQTIVTVFLLEIFSHSHRMQE